MSVFSKSGEIFFQHDTGSFKEDAIFQIYSMTKPITVAAFLILVDQGILSLDQPVAKWIPSFANMSVLVGGTKECPVTESVKTLITLRHLATHTSGITYGIFGNHVCDEILKRNVGEDSAKWYMNTECKTLCDKIAMSPLCFQPGEHFLYGLGIDVLGHVIEIAAGCELDVFFKRELFDPLGMNDTGFFVPREESRRFAGLYSKEGQSFRKATTTTMNSHTKPTFLSGGGGCVSTMSDYRKFALFLLNEGKDDKGNQLISSSSIQLMHTNQLKNNATVSSMAFGSFFSELYGDGLGFGLGVYVMIDPSKAPGATLNKSPGEYGWGGVASTFFLVDPAQGIASILMTSLMPSSALPLRPMFRWLSHWLVTPLDEEV